jgi:hypothetical protein
MRALLLALPALAWAASPDFRLERIAVPGGAELLTIFARVPEQAEMAPLVAILRDTLGDDDPANDRLRYVWTLTATSPSLLQRAAGAVPFLYWRPNLGKRSGKVPKAVIDLGDTSSTVWSSLAQQLMQVAALDPNGRLVRASTRRYRINLSDRRRVHLNEGLAVVTELEGLPEARELLSDAELLEIQARMTLSGQMLGGLMTAGKLPDAYYTQRARTYENRGHNWELLRQRAEANGLYFDPLGLGSTPTHALLWIAREDATNSQHPFDAKFLGIQNPYRDARVRGWTGVTVTRHFDAEGRPVDPSTPGATARELIPLALYGLNYPKVPLLLVDFRDTHAPKRREMVAHATTDAVLGVAGYSRWGNWPYMAGSFVWNFTRTRRGAATNAQQRLRAYAEVRRWLALDHGIAPALRADLQHRLEVLGVNPLEESGAEGLRAAQVQYAALLKYACDPRGLPARIERDRAAELTAFEHRPAARAAFTLARIASLGIYRHREPARREELWSMLDNNRRAEREMRFLANAAQSGPLPETAGDRRAVPRTADSLSSLRLPARSVQPAHNLLQQLHAAGN